MKIGINLLLWTGEAHESDIATIEQIAKWGYEGVEFPMFALDKSPWPLLGKACDDLGLGRTAVAVLPEGANLIGEDAAERLAAVDFLKGCVDQCHAAGMDALVGPLYSPVGRLVGRGRTEEEWDRAVAGMTQVGEYAGTGAVQLAVEALNRFETYFLNGQADAARFVDDVNLGNVGILYDSFHANIEEKNPMAAVRESGPCIKHVHVSANDRATPGEDHVPHAETFRALKDVGYDDWLTIEAFGGWIPELAGATCIWRQMAPGPEHVAREGLRFVRETWAAV